MFVSTQGDRSAIKQGCTAADGSEGRTLWIAAEGPTRSRMMKIGGIAGFVVGVTVGAAVVTASASTLSFFNMEKILNADRSTQLAYVAGVHDTVGIISTIFDDDSLDAASSVQTFRNVAACMAQHNWLLGTEADWGMRQLRSYNETYQTSYSAAGGLLHRACEQ
jgi:hypothetical protein